MTVLLLVLRHVEQYGERARPLIIRETYKALHEIEEELGRIASLFYPGMSHNRAMHTLRFPNGAVVEFGQLEKPDSYKKYQGRSFTLLVIEEFGAMRTQNYVSLLKSNLRAPEGIPLREVRTANPGGSLHAFIHHNHIAAAPAWVPYELTEETWINALSTYRDNPHLDHEDYERRIRSACANDSALARAWLDGDWNIARGAYFAGALDEKVHRIPAWSELPKEFAYFFAMDWGSAAPSVTNFCAISPGHGGRTGNPFPKGSLILLDELATVDPNDPNRGLNWPPGKLAEGMKELAARWGAPSVYGVGDDAYGLEDTLLNTLRGHGVWLQRPRKERVAGWAKMRELLHNAKERNGLPGMWVSERCSYFWKTVPFIERDPNRPEDIMTDGPDHAADAARYAVMNLGQQVRNGRVVGMF